MVFGLSHLLSLTSLPLVCLQGLAARFGFSLKLVLVSSQLLQPVKILPLQHMVFPYSQSLIVVSSLQFKIVLLLLPEASAASL